MDSVAGTVTDVVAWAKQYEALRDFLAECLPPGPRERALEDLERLGELVVLNVDIQTAYRRLCKGMPGKIPILRRLFEEEYGWHDGSLN